MANELEVAEELSNSSPEQAMELLSSIGKTFFESAFFCLQAWSFKTLFLGDLVLVKVKSFIHSFINDFLLPVKRNIEASDEEGMKMKEQAILNLGKMLSKHGKAEGNVRVLEWHMTSKLSIFLRINL